MDKTVDSIAKVNLVHVKPDDALAINVYSYAAEEADRFNIVANPKTTSGIVLSDPVGYRVDSKGSIDMPVIGDVHVEGLTIEEIRDTVFQKIKATGYLKEFTVQVIFLTFRITLLGEVGSPGSYTVSSQKLTILDALGLGGDLTMFSNRDNILVIREIGGKRQYGRVDVKTKEVFSNPYYYLQPNDIVYVEPHRSKILTAPDPVSRYMGIVAGLLGILALVIAL